jgi:AcrR family transcriptional regulator
VTDVRDPGKKKKNRPNDPEGTMANILAVATQEFSDKGYNGARVDEIALKTQTSKWMIYYYFENKEGLYSAVLREYIGKLREAERELDLSATAPLEALERLVHNTFDYHIGSASGVRLVLVENIHRGKFISQLDGIKSLNTELIANLREILRRGAEQGVMRKDIDPLDLYASIAALCFFNVSNRHTFKALFEVDLTSPAIVAKRRRSITDMVLSHVRKPGK